QGTAKLIKKATSGKLLARAIFEVQDMKGNVIQNSLMSDENGTVSASNLAPGDYQFVETKAPTGYILNTTPAKFSIADKAVGRPETVVASDNFINYQGEAQLIKHDADNKALAGALFEVQDTAGKAIQSDLVSNGDGKVVASNLAPGKYQFVETKAPTGYILNTTPVEFTITDKEAGKPEMVKASDNFVNYQGEVELLKVDAANSNKKLKNADFQLLNDDKKVLQNSLKTNSKGILTVSNLEPGKYYFKEIKAPTNYQLVDNLIEFTITKDHRGAPQAVQLVVKNQLITKPTQPNKPTKLKEGYYPKKGDKFNIVGILLGLIVIVSVTGIYLFTYLRKKR
ncbi:MAG: SpaA isopeptide-forming pilin-related protein, partial [Enterococcus sp.]